MNRVLTANYDVPNSHTLAVYESRGGYQAARKALTMTPEQIIEEVKASGLRGRGGAGFPTGMKWSFLPKDNPKPRYLCVNSDESEPGTFKDRAILEKDPHMMIEGIIISAFAIQSHQVYIFYRGEFASQGRILDAALAEAKAKGYFGDTCFGHDYKLEIVTHRGAGAYICGEETGLIEALEGKKGQPRLKPPFPATHGAFQCPTIVNNVETMATVPWIINNGGAAYAAMGTPKSAGTRLMCISGHVNKPGVYEIEMGMPMLDFINSPEFGGGVKGGKALKAIIPGGSSTPIITAEECQTLKLDYESMAEHGTMFGSGGLMVMDETTDIVDAMRVLLRFYAHESCGQCTPCREGTDWVYKIAKRMSEGKGTEEDIKTLLDVCDNMEGKTICPLAAAAAMPARSYIKKFKDEFLAKVKPAPVAAGAR
jgi:NADH-quinone oxidoreductase subunit F